MDITNPVIKLCLDGARAEFEGRIADAHLHYQQAWDTAADDYEACIERECAHVHTKNA